MQKLTIPIDSMEIMEEDIVEIEKALRCGDVTIFGSQLLNNFEDKFSRFLGNLNNISMPNCTSALFIALQLLELKEGDEVIVQNLTHASAILPILHLKNINIKICDFSSKSYDLDINALLNLITINTKAIIVSYLQGYPINIQEIEKICNEKGIKLIEDTAQGLGVKIENQKAGTFGDYGCFSFGANKLLKLGEGGSLTYRKDEEKDKINQFRHVGEVWKTSKNSTVSNNSSYENILHNGFDYIEHGFNFRFTPINFALGLRSIGTMDEIIDTRQKKLELYKSILKDTVGLDLISERIDETAPLSAWYVLDSELFNLNKVIIKAIEYGIPVGRFKYPLISETEGFKEYIVNSSEKFENASHIRNNSLFLPLYENISLDNVKEIAECIKNILENYNEICIDESLLKSDISYFNGFFLK